MGTKTTDIDRGRTRILREIINLKKGRVKIGFWGGSRPEGGGPTFATIMFINERGTPFIPPRPAMAQAHDKNVKAYQKIAADGMDRIYKGRSSGRQVLRDIEVQARGDLVKEIRGRDFEPNKPSTILKKRSSNPLVEDGHLSMAVMSEIED